MAAHVATESFAARSQAVSEAHGAATGVFGGMLDRQAQVDRIKGVLAMLKRYESLFRLPTRIRCGWAATLHSLDCTPQNYLVTGSLALCALVSTYVSLCHQVTS